MTLEDFRVSNACKARYCCTLSLNLLLKKEHQVAFLPTHVATPSTLRYDLIFKLLKGGYLYKDIDKETLLKDAHDTKELSRKLNIPIVHLVFPPQHFLRFNDLPTYIKKKH